MFVAICLSKGQKVDLTKNSPELTDLIVGLGWDTAGWSGSASFDLDAAAFLLLDSGKVPNEDGFVFYNNLSDPSGSAVHLGDNLTGEGDGDDEQIQIQLHKVPDAIQKIVFTVTIHEAAERGQNFGMVSNAYIRITNEENDDELIRFDLSDLFRTETAVVVGELYRHDGQWRFAAVGSGYQGGLAALCDAYGIRIEGEDVPEPVLVPEVPAKTKIDLLKKKVTVVLEKKKLSGMRARVCLVLDVSGSMYRLYRDGAVQNLVDRVLAVASEFDDDGSLDIWMFDHRLKRLPSVTEKEFDGYVNREILEKHRKEIFGRNEEVPVIQDVIRKYTVEAPSSTPVYVVFVSDGGVRRGPALKTILTESAKWPIFWQFVGIGKANYGILRELDTLGGRVVDNANFFELDDYNQITDEELYDRLLHEFPMWIQAATQAHILK